MGSYPQWGILWDVQIDQQKTHILLLQKKVSPLNK